MSVNSFLLAAALAVGMPVVPDAVSVPDAVPVPDAPASVTALEVPDTPSDTPSDTLQTSSVVADRRPSISVTDTVEVRNPLSVSDVLNLMPSLYVGDNGGLAGLKTASLRGIGSPHTAIFIDGVRVANVQSGQTDLGMVPLFGCGSVSLDYSRNGISFSTAAPEFVHGPVAGVFKFDGGSFGTYLPAGRLDFRLSEKLALSVMASGVVSKGDYEYDGGERRRNNDIGQVQAGLDLFGRMEAGDWHAKLYYNGAQRGVPGSVLWPSEDRQQDRNAFAQAVVRKRFSPLYTLNLSAKAAYDYIYYTSSYGDSEYGQTDFQLNSTHGFDLAGWCTLSLVANASWDGLASVYCNASRTGVSGALSAFFRAGGFRADLALEYDGFFDCGDGAAAASEGRSFNCVSPSLDIRAGVAAGLDIVAFARRAYRVPTFNELYYVGYGNPELLPEDAWLSDIGLHYSVRPCDCWKLRAGIDGFFNYIFNKITSAPDPLDPALWRPYNIGKVMSPGLDALAGAEFSRSGWTAGASAKYSYMPSEDRTEGSGTYGCQIPYVARHSVVLSGNAGWRGWRLDAVWNFRGGRSDSYGEMPDWNTLDLSLSKSVDFRSVGPLSFRLSAKNVTDCRYDVVSFYPMPGWALYGGVEFKF